eukprot:g17469.t1
MDVSSDDLELGVSTCFAWSCHMHRASQSWVQKWRQQEDHPGANLLLMGIKDQNMVGKVYMCGQALSDEGLDTGPRHRTFGGRKRRSKAEPDLSSGSGPSP